MIVRKMEHKDEDTVANLYATVFSEHPWNESWTHEMSLTAVRNPLLQWWVASEGDQILGFVAGCVGDPEKIETTFNVPKEILTSAAVIGYLAELGVSPTVRRQGLARVLSNTLTDFFRKEAVMQFIVRTRPGTGNHPWYSSKLDTLYTYSDGRTIFGSEGVPIL
jgi:ribosomal protein S18 acetylase RimI-like enzyme